MIIVAKTLQPLRARTLLTLSRSARSARMKWAPLPSCLLADNRLDRLSKRRPKYCDDLSLLSLMHLFYTHGLGGSLQAQPEIEEVFGTLGYSITRIPVPYHESVGKLLLKVATLTFGDLCLWIDEGANRLLDTARRVASQEYVVVGDSIGGFISVVAAQRDARVSHCILLACSEDICNVAVRLRYVSLGMRFIAGRFTFRGKGGIKHQAYKAIAGQSDFQEEFERVNTFQPERLARL